MRLLAAANVFFASVKGISTCPETFPFVYTYWVEDDACCEDELDSYGDCYDYVYEMCDNPPCQSHPSVFTGNFNILIKSSWI